MKRITVGAIAMMAGFTFMLFGATSARADDCVALGGAIVAGECQITTAVARTGTFNLDETLHVTGTGRIDASGGGITLNVCVAPATPGACDLVLDTPNPLVV